MLPLLAAFLLPFPPVNGKENLSDATQRLSCGDCRGRRTACRACTCHGYPAAFDTGRIVEGWRPEFVRWRASKLVGWRSRLDPGARSGRPLRARHPGGRADAPQRPQAGLGLHFFAGRRIYARRMIRALPLLLLVAMPAFAAHGGDVTRRTMPELSDLALAAMAAGGIWLAQRAMRRRKRKPKD